jgi:hypothetical protein
MVEEATAASASLEEQAGALTRAVGSFKLAETGRAAAPAAVQASAAPQKKPKATALARQEAKAPVAELPRKRDEKRTEGKAGNASEEGWEEF